MPYPITDESVQRRIGFSNYRLFPEYTQDDLKELMPDPWGNPYVYRIPGQHGAKTYDIWSRGPDGVDGGDDVTSWHEGAER